MFVFGSYIIKEPILTLPTVKYFLNMHLGLSPYYRGSGTNFWPFVNKELEFVGSTILYIDAGIDTGDILTHVRPTFEIEDNVHTVGCKVIQKSVNTFEKIIKMINDSKQLPRTKQWKVEHGKKYKDIDFNESILNKYKQNLSDNLIINYLSKPQPQIKLLSL